MKRIPFVPLSPSIALKAAKPFYGMGNVLSKLFPALKITLKQAGIEYEPRQYISIAVFAAFFWFVFLFSLTIGLLSFFEFPKDVPLFLFGGSTLISILSFVYVIMYPGLIVSRKIRDLEKNLFFAIRHLLIQIKSGVPLFDAMVSVARGDYGLVSEEFSKCVRKISTGVSETAALEELTLKNPSLHFRRSIWQISNAFKTGADLGNTLERVIENISNEQRVAIRRYGSQLNPLAMMYMMIAVIIPSLGITFLIIMSSISGVPITKNTFWMILGAVSLFQFMFIGMIKSRRPPVEI